MYELTKQCPLQWVSLVASRPAFFIKSEVRQLLSIIIISWTLFYKAHENMPGSTIMHEYQSSLLLPCSSPSTLVLRLVDWFWVKCNILSHGYCPPSQVTLPVYLNSTRAELLFTLDFKAEGMTEAGDHHYYERGVSLLSSPLWTADISIWNNEICEFEFCLALRIIILSRCFSRLIVHVNLVGILKNDF